MAPVEPEIFNSNAQPLFLLALHSGAIAGLLGIISRFIYRSRSTPPAVRTREHHPKHRRGVWTFALLTLLSLGLTTYHAFSWRYASYRNWAQERAVTTPGTLWDGWYANPAAPEDTLGGRLGLTGWQLGRWLQDTDLISEVDAVSVATPRGFWWTYQSFAGLVVWSIFAGVEGRHRHIPQHITLAIVLLAQLASLSTAQNLFYILLLLTPLPLASGETSEASRNVLTHHPVLLSFPALLSFIWLSCLPTLQQTSLWTSFSSVGYFVVPLLLASLAQPNSLHKVTKHTSVHQARRSYEDIFRVLTFASFGLHLMKSYQAIVDEAPPHRYLSHNFVWNMHRDEGNTRYQQASTVVARVVGALSDNPVISQVGWDVLLSVISLCVWTVWHNVDVVAMLRCTGLSWSLPKSSPQSILANSSKLKSETGEAVEAIAEHISVVAHTKRGRGRPKKTGASIAKDHISSADSTTGSLRRSTRHREASFEPTSDDESNYVPTQGTQSAVEEFDFDTDEGLAKETEAAALAWGLFSLGGLGAVTAGVLGAESTGR